LILNKVEKIGIRFTLLVTANKSMLPDFEGLKILPVALFDLIPVNLKIERLIYLLSTSLALLERC